MYLRRVDDIEIDCCTQCEVIWFDKNEIDQIVTQHGKKPSTGESEMLSFFASIIGS
jgi:Zn-finger nucleic acid-binding protein